MNKCILILVFLISAEIVSAAAIYGSLYDISLNKVSNVRVEVNTVPRQHYVAKNGSFSFNVPIGDYSIRAVHYTGNAVEIARENISIKDEGSYVLDLILFPSLEEEKELLKETGINLTEDPKTKREILYFFVTAASIVVIVFGYTAFRKKAGKKEDVKQEGIKKAEVKEKEMQYDIDKIIKIIKEEGGRTTQKEIRKKIPLSEAKISLMITELEANGAIKKIKKGRGNIIILNK